MAAMDSGFILNFDTQLPDPFYGYFFFVVMARLVDRLRTLGVVGLSACKIADRFKTADVMLTISFALLFAIELPQKQKYTVLGFFCAWYLVLFEKGVLFR
jgi:hypothetical protein